MFQESGNIFLLWVSSVASSFVSATLRALLCSAIRCVEVLDLEIELSSC